MYLYRRMIALFASAVVVGTWWLVVSYAMRHFKLLWQITLVSLVSFVVYTAIEVIGAIRMDPQFVLGSFINRKLLMTAAVRGIGVAALFGIFEKLDGNEGLTRIVLLLALVGVIAFQIGRMRHSFRNRVLMLLTLAGAVTLYLGERGILPYGIQISWVMVGIAILVYLVSPTKKNITTREPDGPVV